MLQISNYYTHSQTNSRNMLNGFKLTNNCVLGKRKKKSKKSYFGQKFLHVLEKNIFFLLKFFFHNFEIGLQKHPLDESFPKHILFLLYHNFEESYE